MTTRNFFRLSTYSSALGLAALLAGAASGNPVTDGSSVSGVLAGSFAGSGEWTVPVVFGDGFNDIRMIWSVGDGENSGFAYGSYIMESTVDVYNAGVVDPLTVVDASAFIYTQTNVEFLEGETLFLRGLNGFYGAWIIDDMYLSPVPVGPATLLDARWYFAQDGGSDFTVRAEASQAVAEPGTLALLGLGLLGVVGAGSRRRRPASHALGDRAGFGSSGS